MPSLCFIQYADMKAKDKVSVLLLLLLFTLCTNPDAMTRHTKKIGVDRIWQICLVAARDAYLSLRDTIQGDPFNKIFSSFTFCRVSYLNCQTRSKLYFAVYSLWPKLNEHIKFNTKAFSNYLKLYNATIVKCIVHTIIHVSWRMFQGLRKIVALIFWPLTCW